MIIQKTPENMKYISSYMINNIKDIQNTSKFEIVNTEPKEIRKNITGPIMKLPNYADVVGRTYTDIVSLIEDLLQAFSTLASKIVDCFLNQINEEHSIIVYIKLDNGTVIPISTVDQRSTAMEYINELISDMMILQKDMQIIQKYVIRKVQQIKYHIAEQRSINKKTTQRIEELENK